VVTLPIAIAMSRLPKPDREWLWSTLQQKTTDETTVAAAVEMVTACGALQACVDQARTLVETGWAKAEPLLEPSLPRVMLRAFGWYVLERHY
jgi:geranylgeranyl pyrophosphate synthase